ncbi:unannotated protein [freshwater metagenome]|uniref:Unannotated protein n=1 Tax=freshwater metagenome TaxID=449393 RepID=A0A6J6DQ40_9ZZZZ
MSSLNFQNVRAPGNSTKKLWFVSMTPFGRPVVPLEYNWNATSSDADSTPGSVVAPLFTHVS